MLAPLPIDPLLPEIVRVVTERRAVVIQAPPGAGKTTRVPPSLLDAMPEGEIVVLEPRRIAARHSAARVASERGVRLGESVGYDVRFDRAIGPNTRLSYVTEGILTRRLLDRGTKGISAVVLDEFHERHLATDLALGLVKRARERDPSLAVVVMSATLDAAPVAAFLDAPLVTSEGRAFPVEIEHEVRPHERALPLEVAAAVRRLLRERDGDVLVFLPGVAEIRATLEACAKLCEEAGAECLPLYGELAPDAQDRAIAPSMRRRVILSTNVAETSITIPGVVAVVDAGLARVAGHDPWSGRPTLEVRKISRASATQRAGRAGRLRPGLCVRLYTRGDFDARPEHDAPEIVRLDLAETVLSLTAAGLDPAEFPWLTAPPAAALDAASATLTRLGALDASGATKLGRAMARLPLSPRLSRMVCEGEARGVADDACGVAAMLSVGRDVYGRDREARVDESCDLSVRLRDLGDRHVVDPGVAASIRRVQKQLARQVDVRKAAEDPEAALRMAILAGFPDRVARRRGHGESLVLCGGGQATLARSSVVRTAPWLVAVEALDRRGTTQVTLATAIEPEWLIDLFPERIVDGTVVRWDAERERVEATDRMTYDRLVLDERPASTAGPEVAALLAERAMSVGLDALTEGAFSALSARVAFLAKVAPDLAAASGLSALDPVTTRALLIAACEGRRSLAELREANLLAELRAGIGHAALARLDALAPTHVVLGNGRKVVVTYSDTPSIGSRLQDFFGSADGPRIVDGRVPVVLHLHAPNGRDVQVTTDLAGFWQRHYEAVRSELRRRYPRHSWPDDPRTAAPPEPRRR